VSIVQETLLQDFLGGAHAALEKARSGEVEPEKLSRETPELHVTHEQGDGTTKQMTLPASTINEFVHAFAGHEVNQSYGDFTSDFVITIPSQKLQPLSEADRTTLGNVRLYSEFVGTGERAPALMVPSELREKTESLFLKAGLKLASAGARTSPYEESNFEVTERESRDGKHKVAVFAFGWETFAELGKKLGVGIAK